MNLHNNPSTTKQTIERLRTKGKHALITAIKPFMAMQQHAKQTNLGICTANQGVKQPLSLLWCHQPKFPLKALRTLVKYLGRGGRRLIFIPLTQQSDLLRLQLSCLFLDKTAFYPSRQPAQCLQNLSQLLLQTPTSKDPALFTAFCRPIGEGNLFIPPLQAQDDLDRFKTQTWETLLRNLKAFCQNSIEKTQVLFYLPDAQWASHYPWFPIIDRVYFNGHEDHPFITQAIAHLDNHHIQHRKILCQR